jgi:O-antigen/teichoic acid export membrane protein
MFTATSVIVAVIQLRLVVHFLPADLAGLWLLFLTIGSYVAFFDLGISPTVGREMSFAIGAKGSDEEKQTRQIAELLTTLWCALRILAIIAGVAGLVIGEIIIQLSRYRAERTVQLAWAVFSLAASLNLVGGAAVAGLFGLGRVATEKLIRSVALATGVFLTAGALAFHLGLVGLAIAWLLQGALACGLGWFCLRRAIPQIIGLSIPPNWALARRLATPSLKFALIQLGAILILQSANPLIALMLGTSAIPPYEAVAKLATTLMALALLIVNSSVPYLSMSYAAGEHDRLRQLLLRNLQIGVGLVIVLGSFVATHGDRIVGVWLGRSQFAGFPVLWVLLFMVVLETHHVICATAAMAAGQIVFVWPALISGALNIALAVVLGSRLGVLGIVLAIAISQLVTNNWYAPYFAVSFFKLSIAGLVRGVWLPLVLLAGIAIPANLAIRWLPWLAGGGWVPLAASFTLSAGLGLVSWMLVVLQPRERNQLVGWLRQRHPLTAEQV